MSTITKERAQQIFLGNGPEPTASEERELARIALASLEAEPVAWLLSGGGAKNHVSFDSGNAYADPLREVTPLYTAPPAPVSVPECFKRLLHHAYGMTMGHDWNKGTMAGHHRAKLCQAVDECRAAMLQGADGTLTNEGTMQLSGNSEQIEPVSNRDELPDGWVACSERMPSPSTGVIVAAPWQSAPGGYAMKWATNCPGHPDADIDGWIIPGASWSPTHWMPLPAAPQQEDIIC